MKKRVLWGLLAPACLLAALAIIVALPAGAKATENSGGGSYIGQFHHLSTLASTVPSNGDVNPYGTFVVPQTVGNLTQGNVLISNFNNSSNLQGTGTTIVQVTPGGSVSVFAQLDAKHLPGACPGGVGLTTALVVLQRGWVIVGSLPTTDGMSDTARAGCLIVLNSVGQPVETFSGGVVNGPWDMAVLDNGSTADIFFTNVLNGTVGANGQVINKGTVVRMDLGVPQQGNGMPWRASTTVIGSGFSERTDPAALVIGPTGVGFNNGTLYVADSLNNRIAAIPQAATRDDTAHTGNDVSSGGAISDPLGLIIAPNGDILAVNGNNGKIVEVTPGGVQIANKFLDKSGSPPGAGALFGLAIIPGNTGLYYVDDATNTLNVLN
jgi:hypothetical protein